MKEQRILVVYATNSGTTADVAKAVGEELGKDGAQVDVRRIDEVTGVEPYSAVVIGAPMIVGWHRAAVGFVKKHRQALGRIPVAYFVTAMSLTDTGVKDVKGMPVCADPMLLKPPHTPGKLGLKENYATIPHYLDPVLPSKTGVTPVNVAFFGGKLQMYRLKWWQALFVMIVIQAPPGGSFNWPFIRDWAASLRPAFNN